MRRRADGVDAVLICLGDHLDTLRQIGRTVVQAGQHMTVQIDHAPVCGSFAVAGAGNRVPPCTLRRAGWVPWGYEVGSVGLAACP